MSYRALGLDGYTLDDLGIGPDDVYRNESGELRLKEAPYCSHSEPEWVEFCDDCHWFNIDTEECRSEDRKKSTNDL